MILLQLDKLTAEDPMGVAGGAVVGGSRAAAEMKNVIRQEKNMN